MTHKMSVRSLALMVLASVGAFSACGDAAKEETKTTTTAAAGTDGTWKSGCILDDDSYNIQLWTIAGSAVTAKSTVYTKAGCADADKLVTVEVTATSTFTGTKVDSVPSKVTVTPDSDAGLTAMKAACSSLTWTKGTATDVTTTCTAFKALGEKSYTIAEVKEGKLYMGKDTTALDATSDAKRPTELDTSNPLTKQ